MTVPIHDDMPNDDSAAATHSTSASQEKAQVRPSEREENPNERLLLFSDGIIAFAITIAAISIRLPVDSNKDLSDVLLDPAFFTKVFSYIISFVIVGSYWNEHHRIFRYIKRNNITLVVLNLIFLATIVVVPIANHFLQANLSSAFTNTIYYSVQLATGLALFLLWCYASYHHRFLDKDMHPRLIRYTFIRMLFLPLALLLYLVSEAISFAYGYDGTRTGTLLILVFVLAWSVFQRRYRRGMDISAGSNDVGRIILFSDCVIGIAITLTAAQIDFPDLVGKSEKLIIDKFGEIFPLLMIYFVGFIVIGVHWVLHYRMFRFIQRHDARLVFYNFAFLLCIALLFIPTAADALYLVPLAGELYYGLQTLTALALVLLWFHASRKHHLLRTEVEHAQIQDMTMRVVRNFLLFLVLTGVAFFLYLPPLTYIYLYLLMLLVSWGVKRIRLATQSGKKPEQVSRMA